MCRQTEHATTMETGVLQMQAGNYGPAFQFIWDKSINVEPFKRLLKTFLFGY